jgi:cytochrome c553
MKFIAVVLTLIATVAVPRGQTESPNNTDVTALRAEIERLKGIVPDQSHAMKDVAYHFTNLWFAAQKLNWPLADFYLSETRSHLRWAVRIIPVRKTPQGQELRLADILEPMDKSVLTELQATVAAKDIEAFRAKYEQTLNTCYSCHVAAGKPFLRLQIPKQPEAQIVRFEPEP